MYSAVLYDCAQCIKQSMCIVVFFFFFFFFFFLQYFTFFISKVIIM